MKFSDMLESENTGPLKDLCYRYYNEKSKFSEQGLQAPPAEMAAKLGLRPEEYSELLLFIEADGLNSIVMDEINADFDSGRAKFI